jgi:hypothetical protein
MFPTTKDTRNELLNVLLSDRTCPSKIPAKLPNRWDPRWNHPQPINASENQTSSAIPIANVNFSGVVLTAPTSTLGGSYGLVMIGVLAWTANENGVHDRTPFLLVNCTTRSDDGWERVTTDRNHRVGPKSKRSRFITLVQAATKSFTNFS